MGAGFILALLARHGGAAFPIPSAAILFPPIVHRHLEQLCTCVRASGAGNCRHMQPIIAETRALLCTVLPLGKLCGCLCAFAEPLLLQPSQLAALERRLLPSAVWAGRLEEVGRRCRVVPHKRLCRWGGRAAARGLAARAES